MVNKVEFHTFKILHEITDRYNIFNGYDINAENLFLFINNIVHAVCRSTAVFVFQAMSLRH